MISTYKTQLQEAQDSLKRTYFANVDAHALLTGRAKLIDHVLTLLWQSLNMPMSLSLVAVGGYGRGELYPCSDIDLLFLTPEGISSETERKLEQFIGFLWDIGLDIGHSVRSIAACLEESQKDITVQTSLLESRFLSGDSTLYKKFVQKIITELDIQTFFKGKCLEQAARYTRYQDTAFSLEPNCKESPGGLRDLQVILWISRANGWLNEHGNNEGDLQRAWHALARKGIITRREALQAKHLETFLQHLRIRLHYLARRREDRLMFDYQEDLARELGIQRTPSKRASELLMQRYYRAAQSVTQLNTIILQNLDALLISSQDTAPIAINERFQISHELLDIQTAEVFEQTPSAILESFLLLQQHPELKGMTARVLRALWKSRRLITSTFRRNPEHRALFLQLFQQPQGLVHAFRRMNQYGILGRYIPAFGRIVGQLQHDLFHVYTVDQHILQVMRNIRRFTMPEFVHEYPFCSHLIASFDPPWLLYIAALFHDIAKGRGGDHSALGRQDARQFCTEHQLDEEKTELIVWLVEQHLTMSTIAQKQDLSNPEVIQGFALKVGTERRLTALYLLTHADVRGTSPKVWNAWKAKLLEDLFRATQALLRGDRPQQMLGATDRQTKARSLLRYHGLCEGTETKLWHELDTVYFLRHDVEEIVWHTRALYWQPSAPKPVVKARLPKFGQGLQVMVYAPDQQDLFSKICGFFARLGYSIAEAKVHTTRHGYALDSFFLLDPPNQLAYRDLMTLVEHDLTEALQSTALINEPIQGRLSRQVKHFPMTPEVSIRPDEKAHYYILNIMAADQTGLLFKIAKTLSHHHINIYTAKIATLGQRVEDLFLISGKALEKTSSLLKVEAELLEVLRT